MSDEYVSQKSDTRSVLFSRCDTGAIAGFVGIALIEVFCFFFIFKEIGFYLDDWIMVNTLSRGPHGFFEMFSYYFVADPRVVNRPLEALHYMVMFKLFGQNPLGYHIFNACLEAIAGGLFFLILSKLCGSRSIAFLASALFLLLPSHNITHYWVVSSSVSLSMVLYLGSLYCDTNAVFLKNKWWHFFSLNLFALSLFNYEVFLPLGAVNVLTVYMLAKRTGTMGGALKQAAKVAVSLSVGLAALLCYLKFVVPLIGPAWLHQVSFDPALIASTVMEGCKLNIMGFGYYAEQFWIKLSGGLGTPELVSLGGELLALTGVFFYLARNESGASAKSIDTEESLSKRLSPVQILLLGSFTVLISYTIFGLNPEYMPTFLTMVNRVNAGASMGMGFIFTAVFMLVGQVGKAKFGRYSTFVSAFSAALLLMFFTLANFALAHPFVISWQVQKHIMAAVKDNKKLLSGAKSILLANCPRYVNEAAVFDGIWDFQSMLHLILRNKDISGGVICDRLQLTDSDIKDRSQMGGYLCATHGYEELYVIISPVCRIVKVESPEELIDIVEKEGMQFELNRDLIPQWKKQLEDSRKTSL